MSRWIDADHLRRWMIARWEESDPYTDRPFRADEILAQIDRELSIEIIRCGECKYWKSTVQMPNGTEVKCLYGRKDDDFCSYGCRDSEKPNNCEDLQDWKDRMWAEAIVTEPQPTTDCRQTDCGDFADRLAYERGVKHAWEVAQKVFDSTVTFYEAEDVAKQIDKDINVRSKDEPQTDMAEDIVRSYGFKTESYRQAKAKTEQTEREGER